VRYQKYAGVTELIDTAPDGTRVVAKVPIAQIVRVAVDLSLVEAAMLSKLARHLDRTPSEIVAEAVRRHLADPVSPPRTLPSSHEK
jgi:hypothetical protein